MLGLRHWCWEKMLHCKYQFALSFLSRVGTRLVSEVNIAHLNVASSPLNWQNIPTEGEADFNENNLSMVFTSVSICFCFVCDFARMYNFTCVYEPLIRLGCSISHSPSPLPFSLHSVICSTRFLMDARIPRIIPQALSLTNSFVTLGWCCSDKRHALWGFCVGFEILSNVLEPIMNSCDKAHRSSSLKNSGVLLMFMLPTFQLIVRLYIPYLCIRSCCFLVQ